MDTNTSTSHETDMPDTTQNIAHALDRLVESPPSSPSSPSSSSSPRGVHQLYSHSSMRDLLNKNTSSDTSSDRSLNASITGTKDTVPSVSAPTTPSLTPRTLRKMHTLSLPFSSSLRRIRSEVKLEVPSLTEPPTNVKDAARIKQLEDELRVLKCHLKQERVMAHIEIDQHRKERSIAERRVERFKADLEDRVAMEEYASLIQRMAPVTAVGPSHLAKMQARLCKSLHNQSVLEGQIELIKDESNRMVEVLKDQLAAALQERDAMEEELTARLQQAQDEKRSQAKLFEDRLASRVRTVKDFMECSRISTSSKPSDERRDGPPCDEVDPSSHTTIDAKIAVIAHRLEKKQRQRELIEDHLRHKLDNMAADNSDLQDKIKSQQEQINDLTAELDQRRKQDLGREYKRTHRRYASHSTVITSASAASRMSHSCTRGVPSRYCGGSSASDRSLLTEHTRKSSDSSSTHDGRHLRNPTWS